MGPCASLPPAPPVAWAMSASTTGAPARIQTKQVVILGDLQPSLVWMAQRAVLTGSMPDLTVLEFALTDVSTVWR